MDALAALQRLKKLDELESGGGLDIELEIDVADEESSSDSDVDFEPPSPLPEPQKTQNRANLDCDPNCHHETGVWEGRHGLGRKE